MYLILITGLPGTGKTTLGNMISQKLMIPFFYKDGLKEYLFDAIHSKSTIDSKQLGIISIETLYHITEQCCKSQTSLIIEANFNAQKASPVLNQLQEKYNLNIIQIRCFCDGEILLRRFHERRISGHRHQVHLDDIDDNILLQGTIDPLEISGHFIDVDTSDFNLINYNSIISQIKVTITNQ